MRYAETLVARGDSVDVIALRNEGQMRKCTLRGVQVYRVQRRIIDEHAASTYLVRTLQFFCACFLFLSILHVRRRYDVIHIHNIPDFLVFAAILPKLLGSRVILDIHDIVPELYVGKFGGTPGSMSFKLLKAVERASCSFADHVIVANHLWLERLVSRSVALGRCTPILNYPDTALFGPLRARPRGPAEPFCILYPGSLNHHQGLDVAIAAFAAAADAMPGSEFHLYGDGPSRSDLVAQAGRLGVKGRFKLFDRVPLTEIPAIMASAHLGLVPKRADGFGNEAFSTKILEFMACGLPVLVARTRVDSHYFSDAVVLFFRPGDVDDLARQMIWAYLHPSDLGKIAASAYDLVLDYSWDKHSAHYLAIVDRLARAPDGGGTRSWQPRHRAN